MRNSSILAVVLALSACTSFYQVAPGDRVAPAATVAVTFTPERDLLVTHDTVTYSLPAVRRVYGKVEEVRSDTVVIRILAVESNRRQPTLPRAARLAVVPDASAHLAERRPAPTRSAGLMFGGGLLALVGIVLAVALAGQ